MKKILCLTLIVVLSALPIAGCRKADTTTTTPATTKRPTTTAAPTTGVLPTLTLPDEKMTIDPSMPTTANPSARMPRY